MSEIFRQNSINLAVSSIAILCAYHFGFGGFLFWFGGLLVIPAVAIWFQFKFALGHFVLRLFVSTGPWLVLCFIGLYWASKTEHDGQRTMNMLFFEMPLYSVLAGIIFVTVWFLIKRLKNRR
ncbi:hypothetical protein Q4557_19730 [Shewanella sp. 5_MG-2023]|uniref:hypothetical protein n=1 Tax=Shewanella sp. 5_MG-2023 TaxID=3062656 RepID=UPI0026E27B56|nr:hypothetical protein [Shewanella sp. 5_MG-2023]MDO6642177.1 hypothetical protein [Shewanella sp. 5_MG-2023]